MKAKRQPSNTPQRREPARTRGAAGTRADERRRRAEGRRPVDAPPRDKRPRNAKVSGPTREQRALRPGPPTAPIPRPTRPKSASQAKARAKARKAKAPKVVRVPLRERMHARLVRLSEIELNPRTLLARVPFVVLVIAALGIGLGVTLWLSTDAAERSYQLGHARQTNQGLQQQKDALERQVLEAQAAPALAEAARNLGMIPSRDTAHLVQDPGGNWIVVGSPKPAEGVPPPPLNVTLPDEAPAAAATVERPVRVGPVPVPQTANVPEVPVPLDHAPAGTAPTPLGAPLTGPAPGPDAGPAAAPGLVLVPLPDSPAPAPAPENPAPAPAPAPEPGPPPPPVDGVPTLPGPAPQPGAPA